MPETAPFKLESNAIHTLIDLNVYRLSAVKKAAYRFADRFTAILGSEDNNKLPVALTFKPSVTEPAAIEATRAFYQELLDQELREAIAEETGPMRALILAHAFSKTDLIKRE